MHKTAYSDINRTESNISRLERLRSQVHDLGHFAMASNGGGFMVLQQLLEDRLVLGRPKVHEKLKTALIGENNQKIVLDSPMRFQSIMVEAEELIKREIGKEQKALKKLETDKEKS